jgi:hypothetical protein
VISAGVNLGLCLVLGIVLMITTRESGAGSETPAAASGVVTTPAEAPVSTTTTTRRTTGPTTTRKPTSSAADAPNGYQRVSGPGGMTTVVPEGWPSEPSTGPGNIQATDPNDPRRMLKYGGSPEPAEDIHSSHVAYESQVAKRTGYRLIRLDQLTFHGSDAIDWEFSWTPPEGPRHVRSLYWRRDGYEYFVYAAGPEDTWADTKTVLDEMIDNATP